MDNDETPDFAKKTPENGQLNPEGYSCANSRKLPEEAAPQGAAIEPKIESPPSPNNSNGAFKVECLDLTTNLKALVKRELIIEPEYPPVVNAKVFVKQEAAPKSASSTPWKRFGSPEAMGTDFYPNIVIKEEFVEEANEETLVHLENGCTNSDCNMQKQCLRQYQCNRCDFAVSDSEIFTDHLRTCSMGVPLIQSTVSLSTQDCNESDLSNLIENVKKHSCLYDTGNKDYKNSQLRDSVWANVASECNFPSGSAAKVAWQKLNDTFRDVLQSRNRQGARPTRPWQYQKQMEFLLPHMTHLSASSKRLNNDRANHAAPSAENRRQSEASSVPLAKKQKNTPSASEAVNMGQKNKVSQTKVWREPTACPSTSSQPLDMFFMSMCETTKNLPPQLKLAVKRKVFKAVIEAEEAASSTRGSASSGARNQNNLSVHSLPREADDSSASGQDD